MKRKKVEGKRVIEQHGKIDGASAIRREREKSDCQDENE